MNRANTWTRGAADAGSMMARGIDLLMVLGGALAAYAIRFDFVSRPIDAPYAAVTLGGLALAGMIFPMIGVYRGWRGLGVVPMAARVSVGWALVFLLLLFILFIAKWTEFYSRLWLGFWGVSTLIGLIAGRYVLVSLLRLWSRHGGNRRRVVIFGAGGLGRSAYDATRAADWSGFEVVGFLDDAPDKDGSRIDRIAVQRPEPSVENALRQLRADELWLALPLRAEDRVREIMHDLRHMTTTIRLFPDVFGLRLLNFSVTEIGGHAVLNLSTTPMTGLNRVVKALEDRVGGAILLLLASPIMLAIALALRIADGPGIIFGQERHGWDGRPIVVYKFRTMTPGADDDAIPRQATRDDPRVTRIGRILRSTSLDELPQLFNVLNGTMSLVGPRPHAIGHNEYYKDEIDNYMKRHRVKPGITGWAQVNGFRGETETVEKMRRRVEYDLFYIENWSPLFDLQILARTVVTVLGRQNAW